MQALVLTVVELTSLHAILLFLVADSPAGASEDRLFRDSGVEIPFLIVVRLNWRSFLITPGGKYWTN